MLSLAIDKYTVFSRKHAHYRKPMHFVPKFSKVRPFCWFPVGSLLVYSMLIRSLFAPIPPQLSLVRTRLRTVSTRSASRASMMGGAPSLEETRRTVTPEVCWLLVRCTLLSDRRALVSRFLCPDPPPSVVRGRR